MLRVTLYQVFNPEISIDIQAYFDGENLVIKGYDIGKKVEEVWGDSDYEYVTTILEDEVTKLYALIQVKEGDKSELLKVLSEKFNTNTCYSEIGKFLENNHIKTDGFSWT